MNTPRKPGRPRLSAEERKWRDAARALNISVPTAKRMVRTGTGNAWTSLMLGKILGLTTAEMVRGTQAAGAARPRG